AWRRHIARHPVSDVGCSISPDPGYPTSSQREEEDMSTTTSMWVWRSDLVETGPIEGFSVEAQDGSIGKIDETTNEVGGSYVVVATGPALAALEAERARPPPARIADAAAGLHEGGLVAGCCSRCRRRGPSSDSWPCLCRGRCGS